MDQFMMNRRQALLGATAAAGALTMGGLSKRPSRPTTP